MSALAGLVLVSLGLVKLDFRGTTMTRAWMAGVKDGVMGRINGGAGAVAAPLASGELVASSTTNSTQRAWGEIGETAIVRQMNRFDVRDGDADGLKKRRENGEMTPTQRKKDLRLST